MFILAKIEDENGRNPGSFAKFKGVEEKMALLCPFWRFCNANVALYHSETLGTLTAADPRPRAPTHHSVCLRQGGV